MAIQAPILIEAININDGCWEFNNDRSTLRRTCDMQTIQDNSFINLPSNITTLDLQERTVETIESQAFVGCEHLQKLNLDNNRLTSLPQNVFIPLRHIKTISLTWNQFANFSLDVFANNQNLEEVSLDYNKMTTLVPIQHKGEFSIKILYLSENDLKNISEVCKLQKLEDLSLGGNRNVDFATFSFSCWTELRKLWLYGTNLISLNYDYRSFIGLNKLKILSLSENNLDMMCLGNFPAFLELEELFVQNNKLKTINAQDLKNKFPKLNSIATWGNPFDCNNFDNLETIFKALKIDYHYLGSPTCEKATKTNEYESFCPIYVQFPKSIASETYNKTNKQNKQIPIKNEEIEIPDEQIRGPLTNFSLIKFALQMVLTVILFIVDISVSIYFYVIE
jgi:Leucine-rich repeat (LRR) protein